MKQKKWLFIVSNTTRVYHSAIHSCQCFLFTHTDFQRLSRNSLMLNYQYDVLSRWQKQIERFTSNKEEYTLDYCTYLFIFSGGYTYDKLCIQKMLCFCRIFFCFPFETIGANELTEPLKRLSNLYSVFEHVITEISHWTVENSDFVIRSWFHSSYLSHSM